MIQVSTLTRNEMMGVGGGTRLACLLLAVVLPFLPLMEASNEAFRREVVRRAERLAMAKGVEESMESALLRKAIPIEEYNAQLVAAGAKPIEREPDFMRIPTKRRLDDAGDADDGGYADDDGDDYYIADDDLHSFSGFALKYVKCQPIQRFSVDAIKNGEYSSMVTNDVVMLRLCPKKQCGGSSTYGCLYNYAEYAIGLGEYLQIMIRYTQDKRKNLCNFCAECNGNRLLNEDEDEDEGEEDDKEEEGENEEEEEQEVEEEAADDGYVAAYDDDDGGYEDSYCTTYADLCEDYENFCAGGEGDEEEPDEEGGDESISYDDYLNYLDCVKVEGQGNYEGSNMYLRPRCDASAGTIKMGVFYDPYCSQYGGDDLSAKQFSGIAFRSSAFEDFYSSACIDCSESDYPPYYNSNSYLCNKLHYTSAKCTSGLVYNQFNDYSDHSTECSFIESIRFGTYDSKGQIVNSDHSQYTKSEITTGQKIGLALSAFLCVVLAIYSCYLHHSITNLLIKSLSHSHLLPPSRHRVRGSGSASGSRSSSRRGSRNRRKNYDDDDDDNYSGRIL